MRYEGFGTRLGNGECRFHDIFARLTWSRTIWADAICINQADASEKNHQVRQTGNIDASADQVMIYIGGPDQDSDVAISWIKAGDARSRGQAAEDCFSVFRFWNHSWFRRIWVVQEVAWS
jgi:hypothetical protein